MGCVFSLQFVPSAEEPPVEEWTANAQIEKEGKAGPRPFLISLAFLLNFLFFVLFSGVRRTVPLVFYPLRP